MITHAASDSPSTVRQVAAKRNAAAAPATTLATSPGTTRCATREPSSVFQRMKGPIIHQDHDWRHQRHENGLEKYGGPAEDLARGSARRGTG